MTNMNKKTPKVIIIVFMLMYIQNNKKELT